MTVEEQRTINEAATAVRRIVNGCPSLPRYTIRSFEATAELLELFEDSSVSASRPLQVIANAEPLRAVVEN